MKAPPIPLVTSLATKALENWLCKALSGAVQVKAVTPLKGGGIQENWTVDALVGGEQRAFVLRKDAPSTIAASHSRANEFALIKAVHEAGVTVPEPVAFCHDSAVFGSSFALMAKVPGIGLGPKVVKELEDQHRVRLTRQLAEEMALIHSIHPGSLSSGQNDVAFLGKPPPDFPVAEVALMRDWLDRLKLFRPGLEWALRWAELHIPKNTETTLIHRDFRTGNYLLEAGQLTAVLDWEFACWGDPMFDIGWFHAQCWRFSRPDLEAGGVGDRDQFYAAYEARSGRKINHEAVAAYEILAHCRWAVIALQQGDRHNSGREPSLEHALTGKIAEELELMALRLTQPLRWKSHQENKQDMDIQGTFKHGTFKKES
jgi:aminoglycoside phosphotransferase (APT) family kinase protein